MLDPDHFKLILLNLKLRHAVQFGFLVFISLVRG